MWPIEARNASIANNYFVACNNRVGTVSYNMIINIQRRFGSVDQRLTKPYIVFVLVDDWGYADVSFCNPAILSLSFKMLAKTGLL